MGLGKFKTNKEKERGGKENEGKKREGDREKERFLSIHVQSHESHDPTSRHVAQTVTSLTFDVTKDLGTWSEGKI